jgi:hypothetical protein
MKQVQDDIGRLIGLGVAGLVIGSATVGLVYAVIGGMSEAGRHILATALVFALPLAYALGLQVAKSHKAGIEHGVDLKVSATQRAAQKPPAIDLSPAARAAWDELLPRVQPGGAVIVHRTARDSEIIDL